MKDAIKGVQKAHTNITVLEIVRDMLGSAYTGEHGVERSQAFERKVEALIRAEQQRLLGVIDAHQAKLLKAVQP